MAAMKTGSLSSLGYGKQLIIPLRYAAAANQTHLVEPHLAKIQTMALPNLPEMPQKKKKKVQ